VGYWFADSRPGLLKISDIERNELLESFYDLYSSMNVLNFRKEGHKYKKCQFKAPADLSNAQACTYLPAASTYHSTEQCEAKRAAQCTARQREQHNAQQGCGGGGSGWSGSKPATLLRGLDVVRGAWLAGSMALAAEW